jgi:hypothetical protein
VLSNFRSVSAEWEQQHYPLPSLNEESEMFGTYARNVIAGQGRYVSDKQPKIPTVSLKYCEYDKNRRVLKLTSEYFGMPREFFVVSHHTGKEVRFTVVGEHDVLFDEDGWDGEQRIYRPVGVVPGVDHMVIYHAW